MKTRAIVGVALTGVAILVSCTQDQPSAPVAPTQASFAKANPNACDFTVTRASAKEYFAVLKDPIYGLIDVMQAAHKAAGGGTAGNTAATDEGFAVIAQTASYLGDATKIKGTTAQGSAFVNDVFQCMTVAGYSPSVDFSKALGATGLFEVVDQTVSTPVTARYNVGNSPAFGAEPNGGTWPVSGPTLFYGSDVVVSTLSNELVKGTVADIKSLPVYSPFASKFKAGVCKVTDSYARALHQHTVNNQVDATILAPVKMSFCIGDDDVLGSASGPMSSFAFGLKQAASWLAPRPLYAAAMPTRFGGGGAGLVDGLSEIGPVTFTSVVSFSNPPKTIKLSKQPHDPPIAVTDTTSNGNPLAGVEITLTVVGNSGSFSYPVGSNIALTNELGIATFPNFVIDKSGGYTITAESAVGGTAQATYNITGN
jgi:hypothetical protein